MNRKIQLFLFSLVIFFIIITAIFVASNKSDDNILPENNNIETENNAISEGNNTIEAEDNVLLEEYTGGTITFDAIAANIVLPAGSTSADLQTAINNAASGDTIIISDDMQFSDTVIIPTEKAIIIESGDYNHVLFQNKADTRHFQLYGNLTLKNVTIDGNNLGGGISVYGPSGVLNTNATNIQNNKAKNGGGVYLNDGTSANITTSGILNNVAEYGGGICTDTNTTLNLSEGIAIINNKADYGGGINLSNGSILNMNGINAFNENIASSNGGAINVSESNYNNITIDGRTSFNENKASKEHVPPANATTLYPNIRFTTTSIYDHPLNNYDISYTGFHAHVIYDANGGTGSHIGPDIEVSQTDTILSITDTKISRQGYTFTGWNTSKDGSGTSYKAGDTVTLESNLTLYAQWKADEYTVTFESNGGTPVSEQRVLFDLKVTKPQDPTKQGYVFGGWYTDNKTFKNEWNFNTIVNESMTLYARWMADDYTVTFESNGGTPIDNQIVAEGEVATRPDNPTKQGYIFDGWYTDNETFENEWDFNTAITEEVTLYAKWRVNLMSIFILVPASIILAIATIFYIKINKILKNKCNCKCNK